MHLNVLREEEDYHNWMASNSDKVVEINAHQQLEFIVKKPQEQTKPEEEVQIDDILEEQRDSKPTIFLPRQNYNYF